MQLVECVPNFSEGRREGIIAEIGHAAARVPDVTVLDLHADPAHNRMVLTFIGSPEAAVEAAFRCAARAAQLVDMRDQRGEHPRIGATDVVPFVPVSGVTMADCVRLAHQLGRRLGEELGIPVYLYARAALRAGRAWLPDVRRGEYEGLREAIERDPDRAPDFGPAHLGPAGATAVGARPFLIAYNVNLATPNLGLAREIARRVRQSGGGLPAVQARGMATSDPNAVQVSMNLLDPELTPLDVAHEAVHALAAQHGVRVAGSEIVGLLPLDAVIASARRSLEGIGLSRRHVLEARALDSLTARAEAPPNGLTAERAGRQ